MGEETTTEERKFLLMAIDKDNVVRAVNKIGAGIANHPLPLPELANDLKQAALDTHDGRKTFLAKMGIDAGTSDKFRLVSYINEFGQSFVFKGRMEGGNKLILTDGVVPNDKLRDAEILMKRTEAVIYHLYKQSFKPLPKPIVISVDNLDSRNGEEYLGLLPAEQMKLETQATFAKLIHQSENVQLASNDRLPVKKQSTAPSIFV
jgi:hypothetical protein